MNRSYGEDQQRLLQVLDMLPVYTVLLSPDYHVPFANRFFRERFGESHGRRCYEYLFGRTEPCDVCETFKVFKTKAPLRWAWTGPDGRNYDIWDFPFTDVDGSSLVMEVGIDVTDLLQAQERARVAQKMESIGRLAGGVAHDFNNILSVITGYAEMALGSLQEGDPLRDDVSEILNAGRKGAALARQLLAFSRRQVLSLEVLDLNAVVGRVEKMLRRVIGEDVLFSVTLGQDLGRVKADPGQVEQVLMNLAVNARDAMSKGGRLSLATGNCTLCEPLPKHLTSAAPGEYVRLSVADTGCGMTDDVKARIFEPFFTTKAKGMGTGLGLATVYGIVQQSGGAIGVLTAPGKGTTFEVYLPRMQDE